MNRRKFFKTKTYTLTVYTSVEASVTVGGITKTSNYSGYAYFSLKRGVYSYSVSKSGYVTRTGSVNISGDYTLSVPLDTVSTKGTILLMHCDGNINDVKGHSSNAVGTAKYTSGRFGQALKMDGTWHVHFDNGGFGEIIRGEAWTLEYWIYPTSSNLDNIYLVSSWYQGRWSFTCTTSGGTYPHMEVRDAEDVRAYGGTCGYSWNLNQWNHVAYVKNGMTYTVYCNGVGTSYSITYNRGREISEFDIGYKADAGRNEGGYYIDELRISDVARYTSNFTPPSNTLS